MVEISDRGILEKKLTETTPDELRELTLETYSPYKKILVEKYINQIYSTDSAGINFTIWDYITRLEYELKVVKEMWYNTYFLIVQDFINRAKSNWVWVWPWRWSAAGSLMAWCVRITDVDPYPYWLLFERFLNPARISMPDIDVDFEDEKRYLVIDYVRHKYWEEKFSHIWTFMTLAAKAAFKDVARTMGMPFERSNAITELIGEKTIRDSLKAREELQALYDTDNLVKKTIDAAMKLEWNIRQTWVHACGMIIAPSNVTGFTSIQYPPKASGEADQAVVSQFDYHELEDLWLLKMDFLGLRTLALIKNTVKIVRARLQLQWQQLPQVLQTYLDTMTLDLPLDDPQTYARVFQKWDTSWIFQFEWSGIRAFLVKLKATNIDDITAMSALYRPGPLEFIPNYIKRKHWEEPLYYMLPELEQALVQKYGTSIMQEEKRKLEEDLTPILWNTYWIAVYQEQLMFLVQAMAGFSLAEADMLRRGIGKKIKSEIERIKGIFVEKAETFKDYKQETTTFIYEKLIEPAASYSFNKSHAVAYSLISYQTAWLKAHYPLEFNAALLRSEEQNPDKLAQFISELQIQGYRVLPPHVNKSFPHVAAIENAIRLWFLSIKWVGAEIGEVIEADRKKNWEYSSFEDFLTRNATIINKKSLESLAKAGAFSGLIDRQTVLHNLQAILDRSKTSWAESQWWLFGDLIKPMLQLETAIEATKMEKLLMENDVFKTFVSWHPFDWLYQYCKKKYTLISQVKNPDYQWDVKILCYVKSIQRAKKKWFFIKVEDLSDEMEFFVKDTFDWQKFDILIVEWYKAKWFRLSKVTRTSLDHIIEEATKSGKYNPEETIADVKAKRLGMDTDFQAEVAKNTVQSTESVDEIITEEALEELIENTPVDDLWLEWEDNIIQTSVAKTKKTLEVEESIEILPDGVELQNEIDISPIQNEPLEEETESQEEINDELLQSKYSQTNASSLYVTFSLPESPTDLQEMIHIIKAHPGEEEIHIWQKVVFVDTIWLEKLHILLK